MKHLPALLRTALAADPAADAALLDRFRTGGDAEAFAELVRRHGRLVWAACRHQTRTEADADDCFQAVWLALARNPKAVRDPAKLSAFLHAVAVRVCRKLRAANDRRTARERAVASPAGGVAVPDSAWDRALAAVHEEVAALPEPLRVAFVRCCLEGQGVTEAAAALGWKLGTLSGRLTRAKDQLIRRLDARGLTAGAVAAVACGGAVPAAVAGRTLELAAGGTVPATLLILSTGVTAMNRVKLLAAGLLVAGGLGAGVGGGWVTTAGAQAPAKAEPAKTETAGQARPLHAEAVGTDARREVGPPTLYPGKREWTQYGVNTGSRWDYQYYFLDTTKPTVTADDYLRTIEGHEAAGWTFLGSITLDMTKLEGVVPVPNPPTTTPALAFRRPAGVRSTAALVDPRSLTDVQRVAIGWFGGQPQPAPTPADAAARGLVVPPPAPLVASVTLPTAPSAERKTFNPAAQARRIQELEEELAALKAKREAALAAAPRETKRFTTAALGADPSDILAVVIPAVQARYGADSSKRITFSTLTQDRTLEITGDAEAVKWTAGVIAAVAAK